jgi:hypothetical protein
VLWRRIAPYLISHRSRNGGKNQRVNLEDTMAEVIEVVSKKDLAPGASTSGEVRGQQVAVFYIWNEKTP